MNKFSPKALIWHTCLIAALLLSGASGWAQDQKLNFEEGRKYQIDTLRVTGLKTYNEQTVKTYTGLREGMTITLPGEQVATMISKLWDLELFSDINLYITNSDGDHVSLELAIQERPVLSDVDVKGISFRKVDDILKDTDLKKGKKITKSLISNTKNYLENKYKKEGYLNTKVSIVTVDDTTSVNAQKMRVNIDRGDKVKIRQIIFEGNQALSDAKLRKALKKTKSKAIYRFWKKSKYIPEDYTEDLTKLIDVYASNGYRDARVLGDTLINHNSSLISVKIKVEEGRKYYFGTIDFVGNTVYPDHILSKVLGIKKGDTYNGVLLRERVQDKTKPDAEDITNLYQNNGYLFSSINPVEVSAANDTIDFEIRIIEGKESFLNHVYVSGNEKTNDHVIYREMRTRPGQKYSKDNIMRTIRELGQLGFFDAEQIAPDIQNPDPNTGTVDIAYNLVESGSSQIELQGGYGGGGFIGTLGLSFSNFSIQNIFNKESYQPVPMGDGQTFALRLQASRTFRVYSLNFSEPWLGGRKPVQFNINLSRTQQFAFDYALRDVDKNRSFAITGLSVGLAKRLQWPDDYFTVSHALGYQQYDFNNYNIGLFNFGNGTSNALSYTFGVSRNSSGPNPIFPTEGSRFDITAKLTPPFSLMGSKKDFASIREEAEDIVARRRIGEASTLDLQRLETLEEERFKWLEYYKVKFKGDWYTRLFGKFVLRANAEFGFLGNYNQDIGDVPFERFFVGGDGMGNFTMDGRDMIQLRGYENQALTPVDELTGQQEGGLVYNKFSMEMRYPLTLKPSASIFAMTFLEAGNAFDRFSTFDPFDAKRSAGVGIRIFMPAFGLLGVDFGYGFDQDNQPSSFGPSGWQTHFIIGQQF